MFRTSWTKILIGFILPVLFLGCTRPENQEATRIKIVVPQKMASSKSSGSLTAGDQLSHVRLNATGEGIAGSVSFSWDVCHDCTSPEIPASFFLDIPMGSNRLIQVLAVYKNSSTDTMAFYYGDAVKTLSSSSESVVIPISALGQGASSIDGQVSGRYFNSATGGPTGEVNIKFSPGDGKPKLVIDKSNIINGWFSFFMLTGVSFEYEVAQTGELIFGQAVNLNSSFFDPNSSAANYTRVLKAAMPKHIEIRNEGGVDTPENSEAQYYVWGFFGNESAIAGKAVCKDLTTAFTKIKKYDNSAILPINAISSGYPATGIPTEAVLLAPSVGTPITFYGGANSSACTSLGYPSTNAYINYINVQTSFLDGNGKDSASGFRPPFQMLPSPVNNVLSINPANNPRVIAGKVLPGVGEVIDGFKIFKKLNSQDLHLDNPSCLEISKGGNGWAAAGDAALDGAGQLSLTSTISSADASAGAVAVLCPVKAGQVGPVGAFIGNWAFNSFYSLPAPADGFEMRLGWDRIALNQCHEARVELRAGGNFNATNGSTLSFNLSVTGITAATPEFYDASDITCSGTAWGSATLTLAPSETAKSFRFKLTGGSAPMGPQLVAQTSAFGNMQRQVGFQYSSGAGTLSKLESHMLGFKLFANQCSPFDFVLTDSSGFPVPAGAPDTIGVSMSSANVGVYTDASCTTAATPSVTIGSGEFSKRVYFKRLSGSDEVIATFDHTSAMDLSVALDPTPLAHHMKILSPFGLPSNAHFALSDCIPLMLQTLDSSNAVPGGMPSIIMNFGIGSTHGQIYSSETACRSGSGGTQNFNTNIGSSFWETSSPMWYRGGTSGLISVHTTHSHFRISNPELNVNYSNTIQNIDLTAGLYSSVLGLFQLNSFYDQATGTNIGGWNAMQGTMPGMTAGGTQPTLGSNGAWKGLNFTSGASMYSTGLTVTDFSVTMRVKLASTATRMGVWQMFSTNCTGGSTSTDCGLTIESNGAIRFFGSTSAAAQITDQNFHTLTAVRSGSSIRLYLDGTQIITDTLSGARLETMTSFKVGYTMDDGSTNVWLVGDVSDILIYSNDITAAGATGLHSYLSAKFP